LDGVVTISRTLIESVLFELEYRISKKRSSFAGNLQQQLKHIIKLIDLDESADHLDDATKQVVRGLTSIVNGLASLRNTMSDGHSRTRKPEIHDARLAFNSAKTTTLFLIEHYHFKKQQQQKKHQITNTSQGTTTPPRETTPQRQNGRLDRPTPTPKARWLGAQHHLHTIFDT
jgi:hypothetical protein